MKTYMPQLAILLAGLLLPSLAAAQTYGLRAGLGPSTAFMQMQGNEGHDVGLFGVVNGYAALEADMAKGRWGLLLGFHRGGVGRGVWAKAGSSSPGKASVATNHFLVAEGRYALLPTDRAWQLWASAGVFGRWLANYRLGTGTAPSPIGEPVLSDDGETLLSSPSFGLRYGLELVLPYRSAGGRLSYALSCAHWLGFSEAVRTSYTFSPTPNESIPITVSDRSHLLSLGISARWALN